jgi:hypothetical protein
LRTIALEWLLVLFLLAAGIFIGRATYPYIYPNYEHTLDTPHYVVPDSVPLNIPSRNYHGPYEGE